MSDAPVFRSDENRLPADHSPRSLPSESLAAKTVKGSVYSVAASAVTLVLGLARSIVMARLLAPEDFGVVALALTFINFTAPLRHFGLDDALIHRKVDADLSDDPAFRSDDPAFLSDVLSAHFSLRLAFILAFVSLLPAAGWILTLFYPHQPLLVPVLLALSLGQVAAAAGATPATYLQKEMRFRELAIMRVVTSLSMTIVGPLMAWRNLGVWAIVGERVSGLVASTLVVWLFARPWRLRFSLDRTMAKWFLNYGKFVFLTRTLNKALNEFDDFWVGTFLGASALGFYSKAYEFALYPRRIVSEPVVNVLFPTFAQVQDDRERLAKAYFRVSSLIVRIGFLFAGVFVLAAPEFVAVFLGEKWTAMVLTFQLMIVYALLDPLLSVSANLVNAIGRPDFNTRARMVQFVYFLPAVVLGARWWGINGVALAMDVMLLIGVTLVLYQSRELVSVSYRRMLLTPSVALLVAVLVTGVVSTLLPDRALVKLAVKAAVCGICYALILFVVERDDLVEQLRLLARLLGRATPLSENRLPADHSPRASSEATR